MIDTPPLRLPAFPHEAMPSSQSHPVGPTPNRSNSTRLWWRWSSSTTTPISDETKQKKNASSTAALLPSSMKHDEWYGDGSFFVSGEWYDCGLIFKRSCLFHVTTDVTVVVNNIACRITFFFFKQRSISSSNPSFCIFGRLDHQRRSNAPVVLCL